MRAAKPDRTAEAGFTLIELLVAMALLGLMAAYALGALSYLRNFNRVSELIEKQAEVEAVANHLRQTIADARVVFSASDTAAAQIEFDGKSDSLQLVTILNEELVTGGLFRLRYALQEPAANGAVFAVWHEPFRPRREPTDKTSQATATVLMNSVQSLRFRYFGGAEPGAEPVWSDNWPKGEALPKFISLEIAFPDGDRRRWPPFVIPVQTAN